MKIEMIKTGARKNVSGAVAKLLIRKNLARAVDEGQLAETAEPAAPTYQTRMLQAASVETVRPPRAPRKAAAKKVSATSTDDAPRTRRAPQRKAKG